MVTGISGSLIGAWFNVQANARSAAALPAQPSGASAAQGARQGPEVLPPWDPRGEIKALDDMRQSVMASGAFFDRDFGRFAELETGEDEKSLFALHQGLRRLFSLAEGASREDTSQLDRDFWNRRFQEGLAQFDDFFAGMALEGVSLVRGEALSRADSAVAIDRGQSRYVTGVIHNGAFDAEVDAFQGPTQFTITVRKNGIDTDVAIDLAAMGATPRTLDNVADHINAELDGAGMITRFERVKIGEPDENGIVAGNRFGFAIQGVLTERVSFSATGGAPAVYTAGVSGDGDAAAGQLSKFVDLAGGGAAAFAKRIEADPSVSETIGEDGEVSTTETANAFQTDGIARGPDGGLYVLGRSSAPVDGQAIRGEQDLVLMRYDSTGKRAWTRTLGAAGEAAGASLAVDAGGNVVVAGSITGGLGDTSEFGGEDSLLVKYSADGVEQWARRFGAAADDRALSVSTAADGTIFVSGQARSSLGGVANTGGADGYVRAVSAEGDTLYTRGVGTGAGDQAASATAIAADGGLVVAYADGGRAVVEKYAAGDDGTGAPVWTLDLGDLDGGRIGGLAIGDDGAIYLAGAAGASYAPGAIVTANAGGLDAMVTRIADGPSASVDYATFLGDASTNAASSVTASGGSVFIAGRTLGALPGATQSGERNAFAAGFDAATGAQQFATQVSGRGGISSAAGIAVDAQGDDTLSRLGLPTGALSYADTRAVTARSSVREGDHFFVSADGGRPRRITIEADDTMRSLTFKVNAALVLDGRADVRRSPEGDRLRIEPAEGVTITLSPGADGRDALEGLGLPAGEVRKRPDRSDEDAVSDTPKTFAMELPARLRIDDEISAAAAAEALTSAMSTVQRAYRDLTLDPALKQLLKDGAERRATGPAPEYLTNRLANYTAGLQRLQAGAGGSGTLALF